MFSALQGEGERVLVVRPSPGAHPARSVECLRRLATSHGQIEHQRVPQVVTAVLEGDDPHVALRLRALASGFEVAARLALEGRRLPYPSADGFVLALREALEAGHRAPNGPHCIGRLSLGNVLFDERGRHHLVGFGHNVVVDDEHGRPDPTIRFFQAPELLVMSAPTPMSDYVTLLLLARSIIDHVELPKLLRGVLAGASGAASERLLARLLRFIEQRVIAELPARRASFSEALALAQRVRRVLGVAPERDGLAPLARSLLSLDRAPATPPGVWLLASDAAWIERDGQRVRLAGAARAMLVALVDRHLWGASPELDVWQLFDLAWPGDRASYERGMNRVHATLSRLRRAGLASLLERSSKGYRLCPSAEVLRGLGVGFA